MIVRILAFLLLASSCYAGIAVDTLRDTASVHDVHILDGTTDSVTNKGSGGSAQIIAGTRVLLKPQNVKNLLGEGRVVLACSLAFHTGTEVQNTHAGVIDAYAVNKYWNEGKGGYRAGGAAWRYRNMPVFPDTTPIASLPSSFSWLDSTLDTDPKNQASCGCCYLFAAGGAFETATKIQSNNRLHSYNTGNGIGSDRSVSPMDTVYMDDDFLSEGGGWVALQVDPLSVYKQWEDSDNECGFVIMRKSGEYTVTLTEATGTAKRPRFFVQYGVEYGGFGYDSTKQFLGGTYVSETHLRTGSDSTTNYGSDTAATLSAANPILLIKMNNIRTLLGDSLVSVGPTYCSLYVQAKTTDGKISIVKGFKKWIEGEATAAIWKTSNWWGGFNCSEVSEIDVSEQHVLDCDPSQNCEGGVTRAAVEYWRLHGSIQEDEYPYTGDDDTLCADTTGAVFTDYGAPTWWWPVNNSSVNKLKQAILIRPITIAINFPNGYISIDDATCYTGAGSGSSGHAVVAIGWDDNYPCGDSLGAFLIRDQRTYLWGDAGRAWLSYNNGLIIDTIYQGASATLNFVMVETQDEPLTWGQAGMQIGVDYAAYPFGSVTVSTDENTVYKLAIPTALAQQWYEDNDEAYGVMLRAPVNVDADTVECYIGTSESSGIRIGLTTYPNQPYFIYYTETALKVGKASLGKAELGN